MSELQMFVAGARFAGIVLSSISAFASLIVIISYTRTALQSRAHHRRIIEASNIPVGGHAAAGGGGIADTCFSCESFLETPCPNQHCFSSHHLQVQKTSKSSNRAAASHMPLCSSAIAATGATPRRASVYSYTPSTEKCCDSCRRDGHVDVYRQKVPSLTVCGKGAGVGLGAPTHHILQPHLRSNAMIHPLLHLSASRSTGPLATPVPAATAVALGGEYPASECDWSLSSIYKKPRSFRRIHLPCPVEYYNRVAANMSLERLAGVGGSHKRRLPRTPSSKIAVLSGVDLLMHIMWIVNTSAAQSSAGCTATLFLFQWVQLFYMFYLASFAFSSLMRLRNMQASRQQHQKRTDTIVAVSIGGASFLLSLLPAVMTSAHYNEDLQTCWFAHDSVESLRWVWMSLNVWVVLSLLFLGAASIYIGVILSNERRNLLRSIARPVNMTAIPTTTFANEPKRYAQGLPQSLHIPPPGTTLSHPAATSPLRYELSMSRYPLQVGSTPAHSVGIRTGNGSGSGGGGNSSGSNSRNSYRYNTGAFGIKTTTLASRDALGVQQSSAYYRKHSHTRSCSDNSSQFPVVSASHPVALAHEALHGRRYCAKTTAPSLGAHHVSRHKCNRATCCAPLAQGLQQAGDVFVSASRKSISSSGDYSYVHGKHVWHGHRASSISSSQGSSGIGSAGHSRHLCDIAEGTMSPDGNANGYDVSPFCACRRKSQPACSSERSAMYAESKHGAPRTINSESATPQLLKSISATTGTQNRQKSRQISYGSLVRLAEFNDVLDTSIQSRPSMPHKQVHRSAKHMSLPLNTSNRAPAVGGNTHSYIAPRHVRQNSLPFEAPPGTTSGCSSANGIDKHYPHHIHDASGAATTGFSSANNLGPDYSNFSRQPRIHRNEEKTASVYLDSSETELHHDSGKFKAVLYYYADLVLSLASKICRRNTRPLSDFKEGRGRGAAGQIRRIEQRVHVLIATGALRVATRAMVPLITQLAMVVWSTSYSLGLLRASRGLLYTTAILMLSTQGLLGMMLYYIFDTQSDASTISLPSYMPHPEDSNNVSAAPQASHHAFVDGRSRRRVSQPNASATAAAHQSLSHLQNDVYYVPHASYERQKSHSQYKTSCSSGSRRCFCHTQQPPNRQQREPTHSQYRHYYNGMRMSLDQDNPLLVPRNCWGSKARAGSQQRSVSLGSVRTGDHNPLSNIEGLNIRRVDRTSNAMQSDTLNGSECVAWSHLDTQSTFDDASVSRFSTTAPLTQHHRPVLNGWEETDLEESDSLHPPHSS